MYLDNLDSFKELRQYKSGATTYAPFYRYWRNMLFSFVNKLFTWEVPDIPQKEIETRLILFGQCGIIKDKNKLLAVDSNLYGITNYYDEFTHFNYATPLINGFAEIGKNGVLINNDTLRNDTYNLIHHYAIQLAHTEVTLINALVNGRATKTIIANSQKAAESVRAYRDRVYKGAPDVIVDDSFIGLDFKDEALNSVIGVKDLIDTKQNILMAFYESIGVKKNNVKKERLITDEVSADNTLLRLNIKDQYDCRVKACEDIKNVFNIEATVKCNVDFDGDGQASDNEGNGGKLAESEAQNGEN